MDLTVNGEAITLVEVHNLSGLLSHLSIDPLRSVIELNGKVIERANFALTPLSNGDRLEIVRFVGGG